MNCGMVSNTTEILLLIRDFSMAIFRLFATKCHASTVKPPCKLARRGPLGPREILHFWVDLSFSPP
jgi:hypothetical protein